jgi:hypothetical protein
LQSILPKWIGCQRSIYNGKVSEDRLFAAQRRMDLQDYPFNPLPTPLDRCYTQFKDKELSPWLYEVPSQVLRIGSERWWDGKQRQLKGLAKAPSLRNKGSNRPVRTRMPGGVGGAGSAMICSYHDWLADGRLNSLLVMVMGFKISVVTTWERAWIYLKTWEMVSW